MKVLLIALSLLSPLTSTPLLAHPEAGQEQLARVQDFMDWEKEELPYVVSDRSRPKMEGNTLKFLLNQRLSETYSGQFLIFPITTKTFINEIFFEVLGTTAIASGLFTAGVLPFVSEPVSLIATGVSLGVWKEVPNMLSLSNLAILGVELAISEDVAYDIIDPLAKIYDQVGQNVRQMQQIRHLGIPFSLINYVQPWFDVPDLNLLPIWATAPELSTLPVDWLLAEQTFDLALFTLKFAEKNPQYKAQAYALYHEIANRVALSLLPSHDIEGEDLETLLSSEKSGGRESITVRENEDRLRAVAKLSTLVELKERIRAYLTEDKDAMYQKRVKYGHLEGTYAQMVGGHLSCMVSDAVYMSLGAEMLALEKLGSIYPMGSEKSLKEANLSHLSFEQSARYKKLYQVLRAKDFRFTYSREDQYALTVGEKSFLQEQGLPQDFTVKNCVYRYPNRYLELGQMQTLAQVKTALGQPLITKLSHLEARLKRAQGDVQAYGRRLLKGNIEAYSLMKK